LIRYIIVTSAFGALSSSAGIGKLCKTINLAYGEIFNGSYNVAKLLLIKLYLMNLRRISIAMNFYCKNSIPPKSKKIIMCLPQWCIFEPEHYSDFLPYYAQTRAWSIRVMTRALIRRPERIRESLLLARLFYGIEAAVFSAWIRVACATMIDIHTDFIFKII